MSFAISLLQRRPRGLDARPGQAYGKIRIGAFEELFLASTAYWRPEDYQRQWIEAIRRIAVAGSGTSALITSIEDPDYMNFLTWWPMWRDGSRVFVQNQLLFLETCDPPFNVEDPYRSIGSREAVAEDGSPISEWQTEVADLKAFLAKSTPATS